MILGSRMKHEVFFLQEQTCDNMDCSTSAFIEVQRIICQWANPEVHKEQEKRQQGINITQHHMHDSM